MSTTLHVFAPAKINLFLHILGQNPNGYHRLQTIFQLVSIGDTLTFEESQDTTITCIAPGCPYPIEENLVYRAAKLLQQHYRHPKGAAIQLTKNLPSGAGLGGGSSDAGATLRALNDLWQLHATPSELMALGVQLGADVPVFALNQNAWAEGIGEQLTPIDLPKQYFVILNPRTAISTAAIFKHPDLPRNTPPIKPSEYSFEHTQNDCETLVCKLYPEIASARHWLQQFGPARLTGSGSCLFLPVATEAIARSIQQQTPNMWEVMVCNSLPSSRNPASESLREGTLP